MIFFQRIHVILTASKNLEMLENNTKPSVFNVLRFVQHAYVYCFQLTDNTLTKTQFRQIRNKLNVR